MLTEYARNIKYSIISFKNIIYIIAKPSVIYTLHCLGFLCKLLVCALHNETYFRKCKVTKKGTKSQPFTSLYFKTSVEGGNMNLG